MKKILSLSAFLTITLFVAVACQTASTTNTTVSNNGNKANQKPANSAPKAHDEEHADDAPRINLADAKKDFDAGNVVFVDTRAQVSYNMEHITGALNMPMEAFETRYKEIPTDKKIIAYCS